MVMAEAGEESSSLQKSWPGHALPTSLFTLTSVFPVTELHCFFFLNTLQVRAQITCHLPNEPLLLPGLARFLPYILTAEFCQRKITQAG